MTDLLYVYPDFTHTKTLLQKQLSIWNGAMKSCKLKNQTAQHN